MDVEKASCYIIGAIQAPFPSFRVSGGMVQNRRGALKYKRKEEKAMDVNSYSYTSRGFGEYTEKEKETGVLAYIYDVRALALRVMYDIVGVTKNDDTTAIYDLIASDINKNSFIFNA